MYKKFPRIKRQSNNKKEKAREMKARSKCPNKHLIERLKKFLKVRSMTIENVCFPIIKTKFLELSLTGLA